jgi:hypothetical protein
VRLTRAAVLLLTVTQLLDREWSSRRLRNAALTVREAALERGDVLARVYADVTLEALGPAPSARPPRRT